MSQKAPERGLFRGRAATTEPARDIVPHLALVCQSAKCTKLQAPKILKFVQNYYLTSGPLCGRMITVKERRLNNMTVSFERFLEIARECKAWDVLECWDEYSFNMYVNEVGSMTESAAYALCGMTAAVTNDELAAAAYYSNW